MFSEPFGSDSIFRAVARTCHPALAKVVTRESLLTGFFAPTRQPHVGTRTHKTFGDHQSQYIGGYTVVHDVSARDWQLEQNDDQWLLGKAFDGYAPIGPVNVTSDEMPLEKAHAAGIRCRVNGEVLQESTTDQLVFGCDAIVSWISRFMTLYPGDVIATGHATRHACFKWDDHHDDSNNLGCRQCHRR